MALKSHDKRLLQTLNPWRKNPKPHDIGKLIESYRASGFNDPIGYSEQLNGGNGGIVEGNGRWEALCRMLADDPLSPPDGIETHPEGWIVPVIDLQFESEAQAEAYAIDHNALTVLGGNFGPDWAGRLFDDGLPSLALDLKSMNALPVSIDGDDLDALLGQDQGQGFDQDPKTCPNCGAEL